MHQFGIGQWRTDIEDMMDFRTNIGNGTINYLFGIDAGHIDIYSSEDTFTISKKMDVNLSVISMEQSKWKETDDGIEFQITKSTTGSERSGILKVSSGKSHYDIHITQYPEFVQGRRQMCCNLYQAKTSKRFD